MKFADFINVSAIKSDIGAPDKPTVIRELVEAMGGSISLWSEEDRGSEVRVLLPVAPEMAR